MKKLTAVEWLIDEANLLENNGWLLPLIEIAKGLEKDQIIDAFDIADNNYPSGNGYDNGSNYYSETFNQTKS